MTLDVSSLVRKIGKLSSPPAENPQACDDTHEADLIDVCVLETCSFDVPCAYVTTLQFQQTVQTVHLP